MKFGFFQRDFAALGWECRALLVIAMTAFMLSGCSSLGKIYVHDDSAQKAAETAQSGWTTADPAKVLSAQKDYFAHLATDEAATVKSSIEAQRDLQLIELMRGDKAAFTGLSKRMAPLTGGVDLKAHNNLQLLASLDERITQDRLNLTQSTQKLAEARQTFSTHGFRDDVSDCTKIVAPSSLPAAAADQKSADLALIQMACDEVSTDTTAIADAMRFPQGTDRSQLSDTIALLASQQSQLTAQNTQAKALSATLADLKKQVDQAKDSKAADDGKSALKFCGADPNSSATSAAAAPANAATLQSALPQCVSQLAKDASPVVDLVKHSYLASEIQSALTAALNANSAAMTNSPKPADANVAASTTTALRTFGFLAGAADNIEANQQPSVNALLVALAYEQHEVAMNQLAAQTLEEHIAILEEKREALISENLAPRSRARAVRFE